ncbi:MAG TPA: phenylalanine--tRNA ligase subunit beta [Candidatus Dormibacteraeota bacterium]|nr:phenylalanine--tRNA ligase subunit beta [Candidatus Dormibacteraeota bacterium]
MKLLYDWLREFVDVSAPASDLRTRLALSGLSIDSIDETAAGPVLDAEVTANRPDCLGHYGVAREVAAIYRLPVKPLEIKLKESAAKADDATRVETESPDLCGRYTARILRGVKVQPSPDWLRERLEAIGQNSINNVVDVTNYVMFELGQPLHAFDLDKLAERRIIVRRARPGEKIRTLDGAERTLAKDMCVIADASRAVAIAGVMGGAESEIGFSSRNILLESAWFDPISVRRTSKALGLRTEASYRFERGADPEMAETASRRAAQLIADLAGGEILAGVVDVFPRRESPVKITLSRSELLRIMGADVPDADIEGILGALGFGPVREGAREAEDPRAQWKCHRPSWRQDVSRGIDLIEEVARHYGYDKFPPRLPPAKLPARRLPHAEAESRLRERLVALGYNEIVEIPLVDAQRDALFRQEGVAPAVIGNPLAEDASIMRSSGVVSVLNAVSWNLNHGQRNLRLFEIGKFYELRNGEPVETRILTLAATGLAREKTIHESAREFTFADLKGDLDAIGALARGLTWQSGGPNWLAASRATYVSLGQQAQGDNARGHAIGAAGQLARNIADRLKLRQEIFVAEINLEMLLAGIESAEANLKFTPIPRFPAVERDFSLVLADGVQFAQVAETIRALQIAELRRIEPADLFRGGQIPAGKYSLMIRAVFQSPEETLTDSRVAGFSARIVAALEQKLGASLRTS